MKLQYRYGGGLTKPRGLPDVRLSRLWLSGGLELPRRRESWQLFDRRPSLFFCHSQVVSRLQVQPELRAGAEKMAKAQGGIARDGALATHDFADAITRHLQTPAQLGGADVQLFELFGEVFPRMNCCASHGAPPSPRTNVARLSEKLNAASVAFLVMTAEDETAGGVLQARMNVVHEAGLFQGRLGFTKAIVLLEDGCQEFSNIQGLGQIRFPRANISAAFEQIRLVLEREGLIG